MIVMEDLTGKKYGNWKVLGFSHRNKSRVPYWECKCDCGTVRSVNQYSLINGNSCSCGCTSREMASEKRITHGQTKTRLYKIWKGMRKRCNNPNDNSYRFYGGRGITICDEWSDFSAFYKWAYENGYDDTAKGHSCSIDRIDCNGPYSPDNCRWADVETQHTNMRSNHHIAIDGETHILRDWAKISGVPEPTIIRRLKSGWAEKDAVFTTPCCGNRYNQKEC